MGVGMVSNVLCRQVIGENEKVVGEIGVGRE